MNNKQKIWAKTVVLAYKYLGAICNAIDKMIEDVAAKSFYYSSCNFGINSVEKISNKIIALSNKKIDYINLKIVIEKSLRKINEDYGKFLILKYINNVENDKLFNLLGLSERGGFRRQETSLKYFYNALSSFGYNEDKLSAIFYRDELIWPIYLKLSDEMPKSCHQQIKENSLNVFFEKIFDTKVGYSKSSLLNS